MRYNIYMFFWLTSRQSCSISTGIEAIFRDWWQPQRKLWSACSREEEPKDFSQRFTSWKVCTFEGKSERFQADIYEQMAYVGHMNYPHILLNYTQARLFHIQRVQEQLWCWRHLRITQRRRRSFSLVGLWTRLTLPWARISHQTRYLSINGLCSPICWTRARWRLVLGIKVSTVHGFVAHRDN